MAVVMTWRTSRGTRIEVCDDAYAGCSAEELQRRTEEIRRTAWRCWARLQERRREKEEAAADAGTSETAEG